MAQIQVQANVYQAVRAALENPRATGAEREQMVRAAILADSQIDPQEDQLLDALSDGVDLVLTAPGMPPLQVKASVVPFVGETEEEASESEPAPPLSRVLSGEALMEAGQAGPAVQELVQLMNKAGYPVADTRDYDKVKPVIAEFQIKRGLLKAGSPHLGKLGRQTLQALKQMAELKDYNTEKGQALASYARRKTGGRRYSTKSCYKYVANAVDARIAPFLSGGHAYMAAAQLARSNYFKEIRVTRQDLPKLPAGAIVVWGKGTSRSGHISIADGKGNEISDFIGPQMTSHYGGAHPRVFLPR